MMNMFLIIAILITNLIALLIVYQILKKIPKKEILIFMAASVTTVYILVSIVYALSGIGVEEAVHENAKNMIIYLFVPVNVIAFVPFIAIQYRKLKEKNPDYKKIANRIAIAISIFIVALIAEFFYFKNIQNNIKTISNQTTQNTTQNNTKNNNIKINEVN